MRIKPLKQINKSVKILATRLERQDAKTSKLGKDLNIN